MQYSPKLKKVMEQIKDLLKKNDLAGIVVLHTLEGAPIRTNDGTTHVMVFTEFLFKINPSYSAASISNDRFQVKGKASHYPSKEARDKAMAATANMLDHLSYNTGRLSLQVIDMHESVKKMIDVIDSGDDGTLTSDTQQNN